MTNILKGRPILPEDKDAHKTGKEALFENCWVLPMVHETTSISQMAVST
jgi:hypothetical protein